MNMQFDLIEKMYFDGSFDDAYKACTEIARDLSLDNKIRSDAYNLMAAILLGAAPYLAVENESKEAASFLKHAIELNGANVEAMLNAIRFYENLISNIHDVDLLRMACNGLENYSSELDDGDKVLLQSLKQKYL